ncbi:MAG: hypothetical protein ACI9FB_001186 [Candidatus Azotimanducaceae bacterium]|jgi:hypothetical protein
MGAGINLDKSNGWQTLIVKYYQCKNGFFECGVQFRQGIADKPWGLREFEVETPEGHRMLFGQTINV